MNFVRVAVTLIVVLVAAVIGWQLWDYYLAAPWTRDGRVRADVVQLAPDVSGLVEAVPIQDNQEVKKGDVLMVIDRERFRLALAQAEAAVAARLAIKQQADRDAQRYQTLTTTAVSQAQREQALSQALEAQGDYDQAVATRDTARLNLDRAEIRSTVNGYVVNQHTQPGEYVSAGTAVIAVVDRDSFRVEGYFEETKLGRIRVGDRARVRLMGSTGVIDGHVEGITRAIADRDRTSGTDLLPNVNPTFNWVRLAQRVPVRIAFDHVPDGIELIGGRTATVTIEPSGTP